MRHPGRVSTCQAECWCRAEALASCRLDLRCAARLGVLFLLVGIVATSWLRAADDASNGTWKLNVEKSKFDPGPAPKSSTVTVKIEKGTETYADETTKLDGKNTKMSFTAKLDGTGSPVTGSPMGDTIAIKHPSPRKLVATIKKAGKVTVTVQVVVAAEVPDSDVLREECGCEGRA